MDDSSGYYMDSGVYRYEFRLFGIFVGVEGGIGGFASAVELFSDGVGPWQGVGVVVGAGVDVPSAVDGYVLGCGNGIDWVWRAVACD